MNVIYNYYCIGDQNRLNQFTNWKNPLLLTFRYMQSGTIKTTSFHQHSHIEIFYIKSGTGVFETLTTEPVTLCSDTLLIINSNIPHKQYSFSESDSLQYYNFFVDNVQLPMLSRNTISNRPYEVHRFNDTNNPCFQSIQEILKEFREKDYAYYQRIYALFTQTFIDILRLCRISAEHRDTTVILNNEQRILDVKDFIDAHYSEDISLDMLAKKSYLTKTYFLKQFKLIVGISPMKYLTNVRIAQAKLLLAKSNDSVSEISLAIGFNNPVYFTEVFHKLVGVSPSEFRKLNTVKPL